MKNCKNLKKIKFQGSTRACELIISEKSLTAEMRLFFSPLLNFRTVRVKLLIVFKVFPSVRSAKLTSTPLTMWAPKTCRRIRRFHKYCKSEILLYFSLHFFEFFRNKNYAISNIGHSSCSYFIFRQKKPLHTL